MKRHKFLKPVAAEAVLRQQVCWVLLSKRFSEVDAPSTDGLLDPQRVGVEVPQLAQALSGTNAYGSARVGPYSKMRLYSQVFE